MGGKAIKLYLGCLWGAESVTRGLIVHGFVDSASDLCFHDLMVGVENPTSLSRTY